MPSDKDCHEPDFPLTTRRDEVANSISHGVGLALSMAGAIALLVASGRTGDGWRVVGCSVYAATLIAMYAASTLSHVYEAPERRRFFRMLDQGAIFLLIAGTYTPFALAPGLDGLWPLLVLVWGVALAGFGCRVLGRQHRLGLWTMLTYFFLGWIPGVMLVSMLHRLPSGEVDWLVAGGLSYTVGTAFLALDNKIPHGHLIWHLFVMAGSGCHYIAILSFATAN